MSTSGTQTVVFSRSIGGYDRREVDEYLAQVTEYADKLEDRALAAEGSLSRCSTQLAEARQRLESAGGGELAGRLAQILALAHEEADEIRERARADRQAVAEQAARDAQRVLDEAHERRLEIEAEIRRLSSTRGAFLDDLRNLGSRVTQATQYYEEGVDFSDFAEYAPSPPFDAEAAEPAPPVEPGEGSAAGGAAGAADAADPRAPAPGRP
jgi:DivIVA domain-containing protein